MIVRYLSELRYSIDCRLSRALNPIHTYFKLEIHENSPIIVVLHFYFVWFFFTIEKCIWFIKIWNYFLDLDKCFENTGISRCYHFNLIQIRYIYGQQYLVLEFEFHFKPVVKKILVGLSEFI